jgi:hypothetical protein
MARPLHYLCASRPDLEGRAGCQHLEGPNNDPMTLKIESSMKQGFTILALSGRFEAEHIEELEGLFKAQNGAPAIVLDLKEIRLADRGAVKFLARCEAGGVRLENCPAYIREWIGKEKD